MKNCELCHLPARTYCESDQAILCWDCDFKVHGANFLVARHSRTLLCHACHAPTAWKASGEKLGHTFSVCERCVARNESIGDDEESQAGNDDTDDDDDDEEEEDDVDEGQDSDDDDGDGDLDLDEEAEDNQVVPWGSTPPPPSASSSSSEGDNNNDGRHGRRSVGAVSLKRAGDNASDLHHQDDLRRLAARLRCETACTAHTDGGATSVDSKRPLKVRRLDASCPRFSPATESLPLRQNGGKVSEVIDL